MFIDFFCCCVLLLRFEAQIAGRRLEFVLVAVIWHDMMVFMLWI